MDGKLGNDVLLSDVPVSNHSHTGGQSMISLHLMGFF